VSDGVERERGREGEEEIRDEERALSEICEGGCVGRRRERREENVERGERGDRDEKGERVQRERRMERERDEREERRQRRERRGREEYYVCICTVEPGSLKAGGWQLRRR
jgi:hypothetical protein